MFPAGLFGWDPIFLGANYKRNFIHEGLEKSGDTKRGMFWRLGISWGGQRGVGLNITLKFEAQSTRFPFFPFDPWSKISRVPDDVTNFVGF